MAVQKTNSLKFLIDISHFSDDAVEEVLGVSTHPLIASCASADSVKATAVCGRPMEALSKPKTPDVVPTDYSRRENLTTAAATTAATEGLACAL
jgi:hypothetical protein